ncbi:MAG TPA: Hsp70 family protein [Candidatus Saccharimonadales bacterium]|nr:Hsp70 family protein [Candidatus Saccharimonadales bacterium]
MATSNMSRPGKFKFMPLSLHLETLGGIATPIILRGTPLPATRSQIFATASDNQTSVQVKLFLGESPLTEKNHLLGTFYLNGIPEAPRAKQEIKVTLSVDQNCEVTATATLQNADLHIEAKLEDTHRFLTAKAIADSIARAETDKAEDQRRVSTIEARLNADAAIAEAEAVLKEIEVSGQNTERARKINERLAALGLALESDILERIHVATQQLREAVAWPPFPSPEFNNFFNDIFAQQTSNSLKAKNPPRNRSKAKVRAATKPSATITSTTDSRSTRATGGGALGKIFGGGDFTLDTSLCFVLMPFAEKFQPIYEDHIRRIVTEAGLSSQRADEIASINLITWDIWERINKARFLIADLTNRNPNVFYEVGLAHAISKDVILLTQSMGDIPFDLQSLRLIVYEYSPRGMVEFEKKLRAAIAALLQAS